MNRDKFECLNPNFREDIRSRLERQFFMKLMEFDLTSIELGEVVGEMTIAEKHLQQNYFVHGGVMATAADIVMGFAAFTILPKNYGVVTVDLQVSYLHPGIGDKLRAEGRVVKIGKNISFCEADILMHHEGKWIHTNRASSTMFRVDGHLKSKDK